MTKKSHSFKLSDEHSKMLETYVAQFPEKSKSEVLAELVLKALSVLNETASSESNFPKDPPFSPKRSEDVRLQQTPQSLMEQAQECYYRAIDQEKGIWYCDGTKIPKIVCIRRQQRFLNFGKKCYPKDLKRPTKRRRTSSYSYRVRQEKDDSYYCTLQDRPVPLDEMPLNACFTCPNQPCKDEVARRRW